MLAGLVRADTPDSFVASGLDADGDSDLDSAAQEHTEQGAAATECQGTGNTAAGCQRQGSLGLDRAAILSSGCTLQQEAVLAPCALESGRQRTVIPRSPKPEARSGQLGLACELGWPPTDAGKRGQPPACANAAQRACMLANQAADLSGMQQVRITWKGSAACVPLNARLCLCMHCCQRCRVCSRVRQIWENAPPSQRQECRRCLRCSCRSDRAFG